MNGGICLTVDSEMLLVEHPLLVQLAPASWFSMHARQVFALHSLTVVNIMAMTELWYEYKNLLKTEHRVMILPH